MLNSSLIQVAKHAKQRFNAPTPDWFKLVRTIGLSLTAAGTAIIAAQLVLPAVVVTIGGYCMVAGAVASAVAQTAVKDE